MRKILASIFSLILFIIVSHHDASVIYAADFVVDYDVDYSISEQGKTTVTQQVALLNKQTNLYAKQYSIIIDSSKITNVTAYDRKGNIVPEVSNKDSKTEIKLTFNDEVVGQGNVLRFTLKYEDENIAKKNGTIWEVTIPGIAEDQELGDYTVKLTIPKSFGPPAYLVPKPQTQYQWTKAQLINGGINAAFGAKQVFELNLSYFLENTKKSSIITEIALPPSTSYQRVILQSLSPEPIEIVTDDDSNWLARYKLPPESTLTIKASLFTEIFLNARNVEYSLPPEKIKEYTASTNYWNIDNETIRQLGKELKTPEAIYNYVISTLSYDYSRVSQQISRKGAVQALETPNNAVCMEFTDAFVAIARAAGIPARQAVGFAYTTNPKLRPLSLVSDVLHAWPEYYDFEKNRWIPIDPTWGDTTGGINYFEKLDFNHIVFAYNGTRDDYPYPAGFYRQAGKTGKDVEVRFYDGVLPVDEPQTSVTFDIPKRVPAGFNTQGKVIVVNTSKVAAEEMSINVASQLFGINIFQQNFAVPPYGTIGVPISLREPNYFFLGNGTITATVNGSVYREEVDVAPAYHIVAPAVILLIWVVISILIFVKKYKKYGRL